MDVASKELFSYHKLSATSASIPKLNLWETVGTYNKHIYTNQGHVEFKAFFFNTLIFSIAGIDS